MGTLRTGLSAGLLLCTVLAQTKAPASRHAARRPAPEVQVGGGAWRLPPITVTAQTNLVEVNVEVRDAHGHLIAGLTRQNFRVYDNGKPRPVSFFAVARAKAKTTAQGTPPNGTTAPATPAVAPQRNIALVFNDIATSQSDLSRARSAAERFIRGGLGPGDRVAIFTASSSTSLNFTRNKMRLFAAIAGIRRHPRYGIRSDCPRITPYEAMLISRYNDPQVMKAVWAEARVCGSMNAALGGGEFIRAMAQGIWDQARGAAFDQLKAVDDVIDYLARQHGERVLVFVSAGFISGELGVLKDDMIQHALRAQVVVNTLDANGLTAPSAGREMGDGGDYYGALPIATYSFEESSRSAEEAAKEDALEQLAQATGGLFFNNNNDLALGFRRLALAPAMRYEIGFNPAGLRHNGKFHKLTVKLTPRIRGAIIEARRGYFAPAPGLSAADLWLRMVDAVRAGDAGGRPAPTAAGVPARMQVSPREGALAVDVHINVARLKFRKAGGRYKDRILIAAVLYDSRGRFAAGRRGFLDMALRKATYKRFRTEGAGARFTLKAAPGRFRLRTVVGDINSGRLSVFSRAVRIP